MTAFKTRLTPASRNLCAVAAFALAAWACSSSDDAPNASGGDAGGGAGAEGGGAAGRGTAGGAPGQAGAVSAPEVIRAPQGPFDVGVREFVWADASRDEIFTGDAGDRRRIKVTALYPTSRAGSGPAPTAPYANGYEFTPEVGAVLGGFTMRARADAPLLEGDEPLPVLVYNHGFNAYRMAGSFAMLELASRGYVVFTVEHLGGGLTVRFAEGEPAFAPDQNVQPPVTGDCDAACLGASEVYVEQTQLPEWVRDNAFLLAKLDEGARGEGAQPPGGAFFGRLALGRVGAFGWSLGGSTALQLTAEGLPNVAAIINYDGAPRGPVKAAGTGATPVMLLHAEGTWQPAPVDSPSKALHDAQIASLEAIHGRATGPTFDYTLGGVEHGGFSDTARLAPDPGALAAADARHAAIVRLTVAFFDQFVGASGPADVSTAALDALAADLPDVQNTRPPR